MSNVGIIFAIVAAIVVLFVWDRLPVVIVALGTALALYATGVLDLGQALAGFGDSAVLFIVALFVVSTALETTGVTAWAGQMLIARVGESRTRLLAFTMVVAALLTALISLNGAIAALLPVVVVTAVRLARPTSQLLMPFVFGGHAGSLLALTGTPVNVLVSDAAADAGLGRFGYFEFAFAGIPLVVGVVAIAVLFGQRLLPNRRGQTIPPDLSRHARTLVEQYRLDDGVFPARATAVALGGKAGRRDRPYRVPRLDPGRRFRLPIAAGRGGGPPWPKATCWSYAAQRNRPARSPPSSTWRFARIRPRTTSRTRCSTAPPVWPRS